MFIIGITGTLGAGKGEIVKYLQTKGFIHFSARAFFTEEVVRRGLSVNRDTIVAVANDLRAKHSPSYLAEQLYEKAIVSGQDCIIESLRTLGEIESLRKRGNFYLFAVDGNQELRYRRISEARRNETDRISFEKFQADEDREMDSDDPNKQNLRACIAVADYIFLNNGSLDELYEEVAKALGDILKK